MPINIATITPASLKAKEVATEDYVDTAVSNVVISDTTWQAKVQEAVNNDATTINGSHLITGSVAADKIMVNDLFSKNITYTGVITGGNQVGGGIIQSYNGGMVIDLVNGRIYIE